MRIQTDTNAIPAGYRLNRAMDSMRRWIFFPPFAAEGVPSALAYFSFVMDSRIRPYSRRSSPSSRSSTRWSHRDSMSFCVRLAQYHKKGLHQWIHRNQQITMPHTTSLYLRWSISWSSTFRRFPALPAIPKSGETHRIQRQTANPVP